MSSRFEGLPMVLIEAQSFGLPIASFDCDTGPSEIVEHNKSGLLCKKENIQDLAENLQNLMKLSEDEYNNMVLAAKESVKKFSLARIIEKWEEII